MFSSTHRAIVSGLIAILFWCWSGVCFRMGSQLMGSSMVYLTFMTGIGSLTALILQFIRKKPVSAMVRLPFKVMFTGFFGVALYTVMLAKAFGMAAASDIGQINLLNYLWPVWMVVLGFLILGESPKKLPAITGIFMGFAGVMVSRGIGEFVHLPKNMIPHLLALIGGFLWAVYVILLRRWKIPEEQGGTAFHFAMCALLAGILAAASGEWDRVPAWSFEMTFWVLLGGVGPVGIAYSLYEISAKTGPVLLIASFSYFIPIGSSLIIGLFFKETMNSGLILGAILISAGAWLVRRACNVQG